MKKLIAAILLLGFAVLAHADVPGIVTYQGRVTSHGTNFTGVGNFRFTLLRPGLPVVSLWSHDNTSVAGGQPITGLTVPVTNGVFTVALGDTSAPGMTMAIPTGVFTNAEVRLRIWFNDGASGYAQLTPDQRITSVGYAMRAANVLDGAINSAQLAPGFWNATNFPPDSVTSAQLADTLALGATNVNGRLDIYRTTVNTPAISLIGSTSSGQGSLLTMFNGLGDDTVSLDADASGRGSTFSLGNGTNVTTVFLDGNSTAGGGQISVHGTTGAETIELLANTSAGQGSLFTMRNGLGGTTVSIDADASGRGSGVTLYNGTNNVGVTLDGNSGGAGLITVRNNLGSTRAELDGLGAGGGGELVIRDENGTTTVFIEGAEGAGNGAQIALYQAAGGNPTIVLDADYFGESRITTQVLEITGGSDLSENFDIQSPDAQPGMIVRIDPAHPGELAVSDRAYDRTVAGVVSGAGGVKPGLLMGQRNSKADGKHPVALTGRVYCLVDASSGAIEPGDLITTSGTPGHGMKVTDHARAQGAIIGKAMTGQASGKGLVLVLVSLQ